MLRYKNVCGLYGIYKTIGGERGPKNVNHLVEAIMSGLGIMTCLFGSQRDTQVSDQSQAYTFTGSTLKLLVS